MGAVERMGTWINSSSGQLILTSEGRLMEKNRKGDRFTLVNPKASGMDAIVYAQSKNYELVGTLNGIDKFLPPPGEVKMAKENKADQYHAHVKELMDADPSLSAKQAFTATAEHFGTTAGNVSTAFYRIKRSQDGSLPAPARRNMARTERLLIPEDLENLLPMVRAGQDAFVKIIEWAEARRIELDERERSIESRENEARKTIQKQLDKIFPVAV